VPISLTLTEQTYGTGEFLGTLHRSLEPQFQKTSPKTSLQREENKNTTGKDLRGLAPLLDGFDMNVQNPFKSGESNGKRTSWVLGKIEP